MELGVGHVAVDVLVVVVVVVAVGGPEGRFWDTLLVNIAVELVLLQLS